MHELHAKEIDPSFALLDLNTRTLKTIENRYDLLKIGLFDIWLANEDRNHNNYNLLLKTTESGYSLMPIDHERCFNGSSANVNRPLVPLTEDESLITSPLAQVLLKGTKGLQAQVDQVATDCYLWISNCKDDLQETLDALPPDWEIDLPSEIRFLEGTLFAESWINQCVLTFKDYAQRLLIE